VYLKFKRSIDRDKGFLEDKKAEANVQHKSIISALRAAAPKWDFEQISFVVGNRGSIVESDFYTKYKLKKLDVEEGKKDNTAHTMWPTGICASYLRRNLAFVDSSWADDKNNRRMAYYLFVNNANFSWRAALS